MTPEPDQATRSDLDDPVLVAGAKRRQLSSVHKVGVAGLTLVIFLAFIWIDHGVQTKATTAVPEVSVRPPTTAFRPAPLTLSTLAEPAAAPVAATGNEMSAETSPILAFSSGSPPAAAPAAVPSLTPLAPGPAAAPVQHTVPAIAPNAADPAPGLATKLTPIPTIAGKAELLPHPDMLITKGTIIPCTLTTAIDTQLAGFVKCVLPEAVRGTTGNVVLLDRGTTIVGEIEAGLRQGQKRVFILWDRVETPGHAVISLASPGIDELGRAGVDGSVDNHFSEKFGAALMLSVVQGGLNAATALAGKSNSAGTSISTLQSNGHQLADTALDADINIPPTLRKNQGSNVSIFVAKDVDFSDVYRLTVEN